MAPASKKGVSTGLILLIAAALGLVGGVVLAEVKMSTEAVGLDDDSVDEAVAHATAETTEPLVAKDLMVPDPDTLDGVQPYPNAVPRKLTSKSSVSGMPMKVSWFSTQDAPAQVMDFYSRAFVADDRFVIAHSFNENIGYVAWVDRNDDEDDAGPMLRSPLHMVSVVGQSKQTLVFLSLTEPHQYFEKPLTLPNGIVLPPSAEAPQIIELAEFSLDRRTIYSRALELSVDDTKAFYDTALQTGGWEIVNGGENTVTAKRSGTTQTIALTPDGSHTRIVITVDARPAPEMSQ